MLRPRNLRSLPALTLAVFLIPSAYSQPQPRWTIDTFAGSIPEPSGDALEAFFGNPRDAAIDSQGNLFIPDDQFNRVWRVTPAGTISSFIGTGRNGFTGDGLQASNAAIARPRSVAIGPQGDVFIYESGSGRVRKVDAGGTLTTFAGNGRTNRGEVLPSGEDPADFPLGFVTSIAVDPNSGALYIALTERVWKVEGGRITHYAGMGDRGYSGDGGPPTQAQFNGLLDIAVGTDGSLYLADVQNFRIRRIDPDGGAINTVVGSDASNFQLIPDGTPATSQGIGRVRTIAVNGAGQFHYGDSSQRIYRLEADGTLNLFSDARDLSTTTLNFDNIAFDDDGRLVIVDSPTRAILELSADGAALRTVAGGSNIKGNGGPALQARFHNPNDVAFDSQGTLLVAEHGNRIVRAISSTDVVSVRAGDGTSGFNDQSAGRPATGQGIGGIEHVAVDSSDRIVIPQGRAVRRVTAEGILESLEGFDPPDSTLSAGAVAIGPQQRVYFVNTRNSTVLRTELDGTLTVVAGNGQRGFSGDGGPATEASLNFIRDIAVDEAGHLYIADISARRVRRVDANDGTISTVVGDGSFFSEAGEGALATSVGVSPDGLAVGAGPELFVSSAVRIHRVFMPATAGASIEERKRQGIGQGALITRIAGSSRAGFAGDGGDAVASLVSSPRGMALGPDGRLYFADRDNQRIRVLTRTSAPSAADRASTNAASFTVGAAPDAILSFFGRLLSLRTAVSTELPLPTELADVTLEVVDSAGTTHLAPLFFVSSGQVNFLMPADVAIGPATLRLTRDGETAESAITVSAVLPGLFAINATGQGPGAIIAVKVAADGSQSNPEVFRFDSQAGAFVGVPISLGEGNDRIFLSLFGTGIRGASAPDQILATLNGRSIPVLGFAPSAEFVGLDQVNIGPLARTLVGIGEIDVVLIVDGVRSNAVTVTIE